MRIPVLFVLCLVLNNAHASSSILQPISGFNCEDLSAHVQTLRESPRPKKEKFSCILNLLKSALSEELENCHTEFTDVKVKRNEQSEDTVNNVNEVTENEIEQDITDETEGIFLNNVKVTQDKTKDYINNSEFPAMIPIFKPKSGMRSNFADKFHPRHPNSMSIAPETIQAKSNQIINSAKFTIPCQRAADVLDMSNVVLPKEILENNMEPIVPVTRSILANQIPATGSENCESFDESVVIKFKPKAISLFQLYGNLLKKITITVLVPYHMSKMGQ